MTLRCAPAAGSVKKICLSEASEQSSASIPLSPQQNRRDREDGRIDSITIVPSDSLQQHLVAAKFASGTGFLPPETEAPKATSETLSACRDRKVAVRNREKWPRNPVVQLPWDKTACQPAVPCPPGTEFLDAETEPPKSPPETTNTGRDQNVPVPTVNHVRPY